MRGRTEGRGVKKKQSASANVSTKVIHHVDEVTTSTCNMENSEHNLEHGLDVDSNTLEATTGMLRAELLRDLLLQPLLMHRLILVRALF
ncbi:hypothetical protein Tco_1158009 [Tanacetum coccineum]